MKRVVLPLSSQYYDSFHNIFVRCHLISEVNLSLACSSSEIL